MGKINVYDKIVFEIQKGENVEMKKIVHKYLSKGLFTNGIHSLLKWADARGALKSFTL